MVAALFPEASLVLFEEAHALDPLGGFPGVELRDDQADGAAVFGRNRLAVVRPGEERIFGEKIFDGEIGRPTVIVAERDDELRLRLDANNARKLARRDSAPDVIQTRPARHAMKVRIDLDGWKLHEIFERPTMRMVEQINKVYIRTPQDTSRHSHR